MQELVHFGYFGHVEVEEELRLLRVVEAAPFGIIDIDGPLFEHHVAGLLEAPQEESVHEFG